MEPYEELRNAIVLHAVKDWRLAVHKLKKMPNSVSAKKDRDDCERFFKSEWFTTLTGMDGSMILLKLKEEEGIHDK